jgi:hypothetical protein
VAKPSSEMDRLWIRTSDIRALLDWCASLGLLGRADQDARPFSSRQVRGLYSS